ncbi:hypothetical protein PR048_013430 [Dryococelus australis]|uniref:Uncharacterized protein n=1 Tax=Dryococelus australis TaxID=614101 RepID=A0ABQ9HSZ0_9NEOP|nr:hypothetical protein PR048_013430 [Dryococelus australis]
MLDEGTTVVEALRTVTIKDVVYWTATAWDDVKNSESRGQNLENVVNEHLELANQLPVVEPVNNKDIHKWFDGEIQF